MFFQQKIYFFFFILLAFFLFLPKVIFAQVVINEFSSNSDPEWVELYNNSDFTVDITGWFLKDESQPPKILSGIILGKGYFVFENPSGWLNNSGGDTITLYDNSPSPVLIDQVVYGKSSGVVGTPNSDKSAGRTPDGSSVWQNQLIWTKLAANLFLPTPTLTQVPISTSTLNPTSTYISPPPSTKATYKINEVKDKDNNVLSSVKIYVDEVYIHHYAPETLTFCDGCQCNNYVSCEFGNHTIKLQKNGYKDWFETIKIQAGNNLEVNPIMEREEEVSIPTLTFTPTSIPTKKPTPALTEEIASSTGEVLGEEKEATIPAFYPLDIEGELVKKEVTTSSGNKKQILGKIFAGLGLVIILFGISFLFWYTKLK